MSIFWVRAVCKLQLVNYGSKHTSQSPSGMLHVFVRLSTHTHVTWKLQVLCGCFAYQITALLSKTFLVWFRVVWEIWLESCNPRHASQSFSDTTLSFVHCKPVYTIQFGVQLGLMIALLPMMHHFIRTNLASYPIHLAVFFQLYYRTSW